MKHSTKLICLVAAILAVATVLLFFSEAISLRATVGTLMIILIAGCAVWGAEEFHSYGNEVDQQLTQR